MESRTVGIIRQIIKENKFEATIERLVRLGGVAAAYAGALLDIQGLVDELDALRADNAKLREQLNGAYDRIAKQSDALSRRAEK